MMFYVPGPKARAEYNLFAKKERALEADLTAADKSGVGKPWTPVPVLIEAQAIRDLATAVSRSTDQ